MTTRAKIVHVQINRSCPNNVFERLAVMHYHATERAKEIATWQTQQAAEDREFSSLAMAARAYLAQHGESAVVVTTFGRCSVITATDESVQVTPVFVSDSFVPMTDEEIVLLSSDMDVSCISDREAALKTAAMRFRMYDSPPQPPDSFFSGYSKDKDVVDAAREAGGM